MKKRIIAIIIILLIVSIMNMSYAIKKGEVYLSSDKSVIKKGEEIEITVNLKGTKVAACNFSIYFDETKFEYVGNVENTNIIGNRIIFVWYDINGGKEAKEDEIEKFKFQAKEDGFATFSIQGEFYSEVGQLIETTFTGCEMQIETKESIFQSNDEQGNDKNATNSNLQALRLDVEGIIPSFQENIYEYYLTVSDDIDNIEVLAVSKNPNSSIEVSGNTNLQEGLNEIQIKSISEDKTNQSIYKIAVTKTANIELANTNLETLAIENVLLNPPFDNGIISYKTEVANNIERLNILAIPENEKADVKVNNKEKLEEGNNTVIIVVTAEDGFTTKKYQVQVYKRNEEEERIYMQNEENRKEELENAYEIERLNSEIEISTEQQDKGDKEGEKRPNKVFITVIVILIMIVISITLLILWRKKRQNYDIH